jgi:hypothetical protein
MTRSELEATLAPSKFGRSAGGVLAGLLFATSVLIAFCLPQVNPFSFFGVVAVGALAAAWCWSSRETNHGKLEAAWTEFYGGSKWKTPAGEDVVVSTCNYDGSSVRVRFEDGYSRNYSIWLLEPTGSFERIAKPKTVYTDDALLETVSKTRWKHLDGRMGVARGARRHQAHDEIAFVDYITLRTEDGTHEYERNYLSPV